MKEYYGFNDEWFVFGDVNPIHTDTLRRRKREDAEKNNEKAKEESDKIKDQADNILNSHNITAEDQYVVSTYGNELIVYAINNGKLYYKYSKDAIAGLNVCPSSEKFCTDNSYYNNKMQEVTSITNVVKVKYTVKVNAQAESFAFFAIDSKGDVYELDKTTATKLVEGKKVVDLVSVKFNGTDNYYEFSTSTGQKLIKRWVWLEGPDTFGKGEWKIEEK